jgi:hypothetical protein
MATITSIMQAPTRHIRVANIPITADTPVRRGYSIKICACAVLTDTSISGFVVCRRCTTHWLIQNDPPTEKHLSVNADSVPKRALISLSSSFGLTFKLAAVPDELEFQPSTIWK